MVGPAGATDLSLALFDTGTGKLIQSLSTGAYRPLDTGGSSAGKPLFQFSLPTRVETTRSTTTDQYPGSEFIRHIAPSADETTASGAVAQFRSYVEAAFKWKYSFCVDALITMEPGCVDADSTSVFGTGIGALSAWADNKSSSWVQSVLGGTFVARMTGTAPEADNVLGINISPADPTFGSTSQTGVTIDYGGLYIHDYTLAAPHTMVTTNRYMIKLGAMAGAVTGGYDYAIYSLAAQTSYFTGAIFTNTALTLGGSTFIGFGGTTLTLTHNGSAALTLAGSSGASLIISTANGGGALISQAVIGGTTTTSTLKLYATAVTGIAGANIEFAGGNNGGTPFGRFLFGGGVELDFKVSKYNGAATGGIGLVPSRGETQSTTKTGNHTVLTAPTSGVARYLVTAVITTTSSTNNSTFQVTIDYVDSQGVTHTGDVVPLAVSGAVPVVTALALAANKTAYAITAISVDASNTNIVIKVVVVGVNASFTDTASVIQLGP